jgi:cell wall-associated NlpC family hydrolase
MRNERLVISRQKLLDEVWGYDPFSITNTIEVFVSNLRGSSKPVASLGSSIRSAARATSSAYRRLPIRWRLAGGSAVLTLVILLRLRRDRRRAHDAQIQSTSTARSPRGRRAAATPSCDSCRHAADPASAHDAATSTTTRAATNAAIRSSPRRRRRPTPGAPDFGRRRARREDSTAGASSPRPSGRSTGRYVQYARRLSDVQATANRVQVFLGLGVLGGARSPCSPASPPPRARWRRSPS